MPGDKNDIPLDEVPSGSREIGTRRLAAILFSDIKDFSKKAQKDEVATLRMLERHNQIMHETILKHSGNVVKTIGDAFLVTFDSVVRATECAIDAQHKFHTLNKEHSGVEKIGVRIGVHLGDVFMKDGDIFGDGVNIASRIQSMAEPGGVTISESVYQQVKNKLDIHVIPLGAPQLKNIKEAVRVYQVIIVPPEKMRGAFSTKLYVAGTVLRRRRSRQIMAASVAGVGIAVAVWLALAPGPALNSLAVLPFEHLGPADQEYITNGLTEEIISQLSRIPEVLVISKASAFYYKDSRLDDRSIARELGVQYLLRGTVRSALDQFRVVVYLVEAATGERAWTQTYTLNQDEVFQLQFEIPKQIAQRFSLQFVEHIPAASNEVYDLYFRGLYEGRKLLRENSVAAIGYYTQALRLDSNFLPARMGIARNHILHFDNGWDRSEARLTLAEGECRRVLQRDSTVADAFALLGKIAIARGQREIGLDNLETAIRLDHRNYIALTALGREHLFNLNQPSSGVSYFQRAWESEPTNFLLASNIGIAYGMLKNYTRAIESFRRAAALNPHHDYPLLNLAPAFEKTGQYDSALVYYRAALEKNPNREKTYLLWGELLLSLGRSAQAESVLTQGVTRLGDNYRLLYYLGVAREKQGKVPSAKNVWETALRSAIDERLSKASSLEPILFAAILNARLGREREALHFVEESIQRDSTDNEVFLHAARVHSILGHREEMIAMFKRARSMNPEYDADYLTTAIDFQPFKTDPDLLAIARQ